MQFGLTSALCRVCPRSEPPDPSQNFHVIRAVGPAEDRCESCSTRAQAHILPTAAQGNEYACYIPMRASAGYHFLFRSVSLFFLVARVSFIRALLTCNLIFVQVCWAVVCRIHA
jgi:hypothetical protein